MRDGPGRQRILRELSEALASGSGALARDLGALAQLDLCEAEALLSSDLDAHAPEVSPAAEGFELLSLRHPILVLQGKKVVASHVRLAAPARALIVSGPNGGGKTVAISAVGLAAVMLRAGLPVAAAAGSRLPFYLEVRAAVDERGDLHKDLSTFTAHLTSVKDMLEGAVPGSLVLVDEIAADTDPREGAALAAAILEALLERGATALVTTKITAKMPRTIARVASKASAPAIWPTPSAISWKLGRRRTSRHTTRICADASWWTGSGTLPTRGPPLCSGNGRWPWTRPSRLVTPGWRSGMCSCISPTWTTRRTC